eukprot:CAMPEP_0170524456 /NCGR_PEP_ID=MMETSP0209-20121228/9897_1 /TAXON_ID=665100 ORGANISM="Litonotus pictus, Strain P1" /NCGR_SAMPLE_ID=MMETSP0209 /ASSEMBLY_ACC=CAM_ASM_000301 /LENGTH=1671 /DNA_ID=CAMNT_0010813141 /DNA_START=519 /DNA_END=5534 /DNA_ORIENTATION=+
MEGFLKILAFYISNQIEGTVYSIIEFCMKQSEMSLNRIYSENSLEDAPDFTQRNFLGSKPFLYDIRELLYRNNINVEEGNNNSNKASNDNNSDNASYSIISFYLSRENHNFHSLNKNCLVSSDQSNDMLSSAQNNSNSNFNNKAKRGFAITKPNSSSNNSNPKDLLSHKQTRLEDSYLNLVSSLFQDIKYCLIINQAFSTNTSSSKDFIWPTVKKNTEETKAVMDIEFNLSMKLQLFKLLTNFLVSNSSSSSDTEKSNLKISQKFSNHFNNNIGSTEKQVKGFSNTAADLVALLKTFILNYNSEVLKGKGSNTSTSSNSLTAEDGRIKVLDSENAFCIKHYLNSEDTIEVKYSFADFNNLNKASLLLLIEPLIKVVGKLIGVSRNSLVLNQHSITPVYINMVIDLVSQEDTGVANSLSNTNLNTGSIEADSTNPPLTNYPGYIFYNPSLSRILFLLSEFYSKNYVFFVHIKEIKNMVTYSHSTNNSIHNTSSIQNTTPYVSSKNNNSYIGNQVGGVVSHQSETPKIKAKYYPSILFDNEFQLGEDLEDQAFIYEKVVKKFKCTVQDLLFEKGFLYAKCSFNKVLENNKNLSSLIFKYNHKMFYYLLSKKANSKNYSKLRLTVNSVLCFLKLTKIYSEKKIFKQVNYMLTDMISEQYDVNERLYSNNNIERISMGSSEETNREDRVCLVTQQIMLKNKAIVSSSNTINNSTDSELTIFLDFAKSKSLTILLPKFHSYLTQLSKIWKDYLNDIYYLYINQSSFFRNVSELIKQKVLTIKTIIFLFSLSYEFTNLLSIKGFLQSQFIKTIINDFSVLRSIAQDMIEHIELLSLSGLFTRNIEGLSRMIEEDSGSSNQQGLSLDIRSVQSLNINLSTILYRKHLSLTLKRNTIGNNRQSARLIGTSEERTFDKGDATINNKNSMRINISNSNQSSTVNKNNKGIQYYNNNSNIGSMNNSMNNSDNDFYKAKESSSQNRDFSNHNNTQSLLSTLTLLKQSNLSTMNSTLTISNGFNLSKLGGSKAGRLDQTEQSNFLKQQDQGKGNSVNTSKDKSYLKNTNNNLSSLNSRPQVLSLSDTFDIASYIKQVSTTMKSKSFISKVGLNSGNMVHIINNSKKSNFLRLNNNSNSNNNNLSSNAYDNLEDMHSNSISNINTNLQLSQFNLVNFTVDLKSNNNTANIEGVSNFNTRTGTNNINNNMSHLPISPTLLILQDPDSNVKRMSLDENCNNQIENDIGAEMVAVNIKGQNKQSNPTDLTKTKNSYANQVNESNSNNNQEEEISVSKDNSSINVQLQEGAAITKGNHTQVRSSSNSNSQFVNQRGYENSKLNNINRIKGKPSISKNSTLSAKCIQLENNNVNNISNSNLDINTKDIQMKEGRSHQSQVQQGRSKSTTSVNSDVPSASHSITINNQRSSTNIDLSSNLNNSQESGIKQGPPIGKIYQKMEVQRQLKKKLNANEILGQFKQSLQDTPRNSSLSKHNEATSNNNNPTHLIQKKSSIAKSEFTENDSVSVTDNSNKRSIISVYNRKIKNNLLSKDSKGSALNSENSHLQKESTKEELSRLYSLGNLDIEIEKLKKQLQSISDTDRAINEAVMVQFSELEDDEDEAEIVSLTPEPLNELNTELNLRDVNNFANLDYKEKIRGLLGSSAEGFDRAFYEDLLREIDGVGENISSL